MKTKEKNMDLTVSKSQKDLLSFYPHPFIHVTQIQIIVRSYRLD